MGSENGLAVEVVEADDSIEVINQKIEKAKDDLAFTLLDFLDDRNRMDSPYKDRVQSFIENPDPNGEVDYCVSLFDVKELDAEYTFHIGSSDDDDYQESYDYYDWQDWCERMVRLYGCRITTTEERVPDDGKPVQYSCFYELDPLGVVNQTVIDLHNDLGRYWYLMDRLAAETGMTRCEQMRFAISDFESLAETLHEEIERMKKALETEKRC